MVLHVFSNCTDLSDSHGAENVEEDEGTVSDIITHQISVGDSLEEREGLKWKFGYHVPIKTAEAKVIPSAFIEPFHYAPSHVQYIT